MPSDMVLLYPTLKNFKSLPDLAKSYGELDKMMKTRVSIPGENAKPEEWSDFYAKVGRPETPDKYAIPDTVSKLPGVTPEYLSSFQKMAFEAGFSQKQVEILTGWAAGQATGFNANADQQKTAWDMELRSEWGYAYDKNVGLAQEALATLIDGKSDHPFAKLLDDTGLGNHPAAIRFFAELGAAMGEGEFVEGESVPSEADASAAKENIAKVMNDFKHPFWSAQLAGHDDAVQQMMRWREIVTAAEEAKANG